jgi:hypothetical protein
MDTRDTALEGIPFVWTTNLPQAALVEIYDFLRSDSDFVRICTPQTGNPFDLRISTEQYDRIIKYRDGYCHLSASPMHIEAIFLNSAEKHELDIQLAREKELAELEEFTEKEERRQHFAHRRNFENEDDRLDSAAIAAAGVNDYQRALDLYLQRYSLRSEYTSVSSSEGWDVLFDAMNTLSRSATVEYGLKCLECCLGDLHHYYYFFDKYLSHNTTQRSPADISQEAGKMLSAAQRRFGSTGDVFKRHSLALARHGHIKFAIDICRTAISLNLKDDTKAGFPGRIARLEKRTQQGAIVLRETRGGSRAPQP